MKQPPGDDPAQRLYKRTYAVATLLSFVLMIVLCALMVYALTTIERLSLPVSEAWKSGLNSVFIGQACRFTAKGAELIASWRVRRAGLSREAHLTQSIPDAGERAWHNIARNSAVEIYTVPSQSKRRLTNGSITLLMAALCGAMLYVAYDLDEPITYREPGFYAVLSLSLLGALFLYKSICDPPDLRADIKGFCLYLSDGMPRLVRWKRLQVLEIETHYDVLGNLAQIQLRCRDARGKKFRTLELWKPGKKGPQDAEVLVACLRDLCTEDAGSST